MKDFLPLQEVLKNLQETWSAGEKKKCRFCRMTAAGEGEERECVCHRMFLSCIQNKVYAINIVLHQKEGHRFDLSTSEVQSAEATGLSVTLHFF